MRRLTNLALIRFGIFTPLPYPPPPGQGVGGEFIIPTPPKAQTLFRNPADKELNKKKKRR